MPTLPVSYTTVDLIYQVLTPKVGSNTVLTSVHIANMASMAESEINAILGKAYTLPIAYDVPMLTAAATHLGAYFCARRLFIQEQKTESPWVTQYRKDAQDIIQNIMDGRLELVTASGTVVARLSTGAGRMWSNTQGYLPTFVELDATMLRQDPTKTQDLEDERTD